jgi:hypothetical protein
MDLRDLIPLVAALTLAFYGAVMFALSWWESPESLGLPGVIVLRPEGLDGHTEEIGRFGDAPIYRSVTFRGMEYEFAGIVPPRCQRRIDENELYLDPGLLYMLRSPRPPAHRRLL